MIPKKRDQVTSGATKNAGGEGLRDTKGDAHRLAERKGFQQKY